MEKLKLGLESKIKNYRELTIFSKLNRKGFEVYKKGWPDFLAYNPNTKKIIFVEVKRTTASKPKPGWEKFESKSYKRGGGLSSHQIKVSEILSNFCEVWVVRVK